jgi:tetratricopeptide (TPR) repeat protein
VIALAKRHTVRALLLIACGGAAAALCGFASAHGGRDDHIASVDAQIASQPAGAALYLRRAELHRIYREFDEADEDYAQALALEPEHPEAVWLRARSKLEGGKAGVAISQLNAYLERFPEHASARLTRARALFAIGNSAQSAADYAIALAALPETPPELYIEQRDAQQSAGISWEIQLASIERGLRRLGPVPSLEDAALELELRAKRWDAALSRLERQASGAARQERWLYRRGLVLAQAGRADEALKAFRATLHEIDKLPPNLRNHRATIALADEVPREMAKLAALVK